MVSQSFGGSLDGVSFSATGSDEEGTVGDDAVVSKMISRGGILSADCVSSSDEDKPPPPNRPIILPDYPTVRNSNNNRY